LGEKHKNIFKFNIDKSIFENLIDLNSWINQFIKFKSGITNITTTIEDIINDQCGVCQDFSHLFCSIARKNNVPTRYVSGYLNQGDGFLGDSQMHAWVEAFIPNIGWVGFDPTNNLLTNYNHIKVSHGKDYNDCSPLKGVVYSSGENSTKQTVDVTYQHQQ
jgi:transglutaminase-like putative cysteine protease